MGQGYEGVLIGGPQAGRRVTNRTPVFTVAQVPSILSAPVTAQQVPADPPPIRTTEYRHEKLRFYDENVPSEPIKEIGLWVPIDRSVAWAIDELLFHYEAEHS